MSDGFNEKLIVLLDTELAPRNIIKLSYHESFSLDRIVSESERTYPQNCALLVVEKKLFSTSEFTDFLLHFLSSIGVCSYSLHDPQEMSSPMV
jgi:hypothetical protein